MHRHERQGRRHRPLIYGLMTLALLIMPGAARSALAQGEWATNGVNIHNTNAGQVGIGTTTPGQLLTVYGTKIGTYSESAAPNANASIYNVNASAGNNEYASLRFQVSADNLAHNAIGYITLVKPLNSNNGAEFAFTVRKAAGTFDEAVRISSVGNVGIGTTSPLAPLHIGPNADFSSVNLHAGARLEPNLVGGPSAAYDRGLIVAPVQTAAAAGNSILIYARPSIATGVTQINQYGLYIDNPKPAVGTITNYYPGIFMGGNVGIGTATPAAKLDVNGTVNADAFTVNGAPFTASQWATSGTTINYAAGNVGIGTATPASKLDVSGTVNATAFTVNGSPFTGSQWASSGPNINYAAGNVGVGTTAPAAQLHVLGTSNVTTFAGLPYNMMFHSDNPAVTDTGVGVAGGGPGFLFGGYYNATAVTTFGGIHSVKENGTVGNYAAALLFSTRQHGTTLKERMRITSTGNVGIGTTTPTKKLQVVGDVEATNINATGDITADGSINAKYQDVAEWVPARAKLAAGTVVVLDAGAANQVMASTHSYDTKVAGVVSAQPGLILGQAGEDKAMVATTGRVKVKVDATRAPIKVGDLLVTSDVEGVAMKSEPLDLGGTPIHRPGTLIGKALEPLEKGAGEILVLLSLQ